MLSFFRGLRGKLTLTYTLVTVLALMALEALVLGLFILVTGLDHTDQRDYLGDVVTVLNPQARAFLQPGQEDPAGLQSWLEQLAASGYASLPPQYFYDSPAAVIDRSDPLLVVSPTGTVVAQAPQGINNLVGRHYTPPAGADNQRILDQALAGSSNPLSLYIRTARGTFRLAVPIWQTPDHDTPVVGVILVTIKPAPPFISSTWPVFLGWVLITGALLLLAVAPLGALFGLVMAGGLTRRLAALTRAVDAWSEGDFRSIPPDRSKDEIGLLWMRSRRMAERIQALLQTQQALAQLEERNRLARELHDTVKQQNFATLMQVRAARNQLKTDPAAAEQYLLAAEELIKTSQQELGSMIADLSPAALAGQGLTEALKTYLVDWSKNARIPADFQTEGGPRRLPLAMEQTLYRVAQEALSNVARHSRASAVTVRLGFREGAVRMEICDNGVGFDPKQVDGAGFGLRSMRERLDEIGGWLEIKPAPEGGACLVAITPLTPPTELTETIQTPEAGSGNG